MLASIFIINNNGSGFEWHYNSWQSKTRMDVTVKRISRETAAAMRLENFIFKF